MVFSESDGQTLVKGARYSVELYLRSPIFDGRNVEKFLERYADSNGAFVSVSHWPTMTLRGSCGKVWQSGPLGKKIVSAAVEAAMGGEKFVPMSHLELEHCVIEVGIISHIEQVSHRGSGARLRAVGAGDGVLVRYGLKTGMSMPSAAARRGWTKQQSLENACEDAGMERESWKRPEVGLYKFKAQTFRETEPEGRIGEIL